MWPTPNQPGLHLSVSLAVRNPCTSPGARLTDSTLLSPPELPVPDLLRTLSTRLPSPLFPPGRQQDTDIHDFSCLQGDGDVPW